MASPGQGEIRIAVDVGGAHYTARNRHTGGVSAQEVLEALPHLVRTLEGSLERIARLEEVRKSPETETAAVVETAAE
jgi:hypothetical protein